MYSTCSNRWRLARPWREDPSFGRFRVWWHCGLLLYRRQRRELLYPIAGDVEWAGRNKSAAIDEGGNWARRRRDPTRIFLVIGGFPLHIPCLFGYPWCSCSFSPFMKSCLIRFSHSLHIMLSNAGAFFTIRLNPNPCHSFLTFSRSRS